MTLLATPILLLVTIAIIFSMLNDKRRARKRRGEPDYSTLDDDELSPLTLSDDD